MNHIKVLLLLITGIINSSSSNSTAFSSLQNEDGTWNVTYNCSYEKEEDLTVGIWGSAFPEDMHSLTIANCKHLNILIEQHRNKRNFSELLVDNVDFCKITREGDGKVESGLPRRCFFTNVKSLIIDVPLYQSISGRDEYFTDGVLYFSNTTIENFIPRAIYLEKPSMKKFSMSGVHVKNASEDAISFHGNNDSVLEIRNSFFHTVPNNFIKCNVTKVKIWKNKFGNLKQRSFHLKSENIDFTANTVERLEGYAFKISLNPYNSIRNNDFRGIAVEETLSLTSFLKRLPSKGKNAEEFTPKLHDGYIVRASDGINMEKEGEKCYESLKEKCLNRTKNFPEMREKSFFSLFGKNIPLLWFLSVTFLILLFPTAYFIKTYLCRSIHKVFPLEIKHEQLINMDGNDSINYSK